ncbi:phosphatase PAP2 family protein [Massilia forsythiae]|uniref:Phosphatase PAP2 family protein n=1 Tax=Massilia forsythiae TaxID=2728020 RepID=A0A7Z2W0M0_9BURK|nr:phosphatase PAP2 family protein [Massilia forsythiae]QJE02882.1 phosphatase PAP2 family protein [Massilia forsythiae]
MSWSDLLHLGDLSLTVPTGSAIAAWLLAGRAWRAAAGWTLVFGCTLGLVAASKIAFLGWDAGVPALQFKALSGHATGFALAFPTLCHVLAARLAPAMRRAVTGTALALAAVVAAALVHAGEHTPAEATVGWLIGIGAFVCAVRLTHDAPPAPRPVALACAIAAFIATAWAIRWLPVGYWLIKLALLLSGNHAPFPWDQDG